MQYIKQNFTDGQTLKAEHLNHIEEGIGNAVARAEETLVMAKAYADSQRLAHAEPGKVLTFDGDTTDKQNLDGVFYKISDTSVDLNAVTKVVVSVHPDVASATGMPETMEFGKDRLTVEKNDNGDVLSGDDMPLVVSYDGVYVIVESGEAAGLEGVKVGAWVSRIEFAETIHPIDPKYLPEGSVGYSTYSDPLCILPNDNYNIESGELMIEYDGEIGTGDLLTVTLDGTKYTASAKDFMGAIAFGNLSAVGGEDTGEPFLFVRNDDMSVVVVVAEVGSEETTSHRVEITKVTETVHQINAKYIPSDSETVLDISNIDLTGDNHDFIEVDDEFATAFMQGVERGNLKFFRVEQIEGTSDATMITCWYYPTRCLITTNLVNGDKAYTAAFNYGSEIIFILLGNALRVVV